MLIAIIIFPLSGIYINSSLDPCFRDWRSRMNKIKTPRRGTVHDDSVFLTPIDFAITALKIQRDLMCVRDVRSI